jgi:hypothetical protein
LFVVSQSRSGGDLKTDIWKFIKERKGQVVTQQEIEDHFKDCKLQTIKTYLCKLNTENHIKRVGKKQYTLSVNAIEKEEVKDDITNQCIDELTKFFKDNKGEMAKTSQIVNKFANYSRVIYKALGSLRQNGFIDLWRGSHSREYYCHDKPVNIPYGVRRIAYVEKIE